MAKRVPPWIRIRNRRRVAASLIAVVLGIVIAAILFAAYSIGQRAPVENVSNADVRGSSPVSRENITPSGDLPRADLTPGATMSTDTSTVCRPGYATSVRPTGSLWRRLKDEAFRRYGIAPGGGGASYEMDHLVPLELGGDPTNLDNIWPEPMSSARQKDVVENELHALVCTGQMNLVDAQRAIATNWMTALPQR